jgi:Domain of unknown function (DUF4384)
MKSSHFDAISAILLLFCLVPHAEAQNDDELIRSFMSTRDRVVTHQSKAKPKAKPRARPPRPIGLGLTLFQRGPRDAARRVSTSHEFRTGDAVRLMVESNINGYLYIFHIENDGPAKMIFPDARLTGGNNLVQAHVLREVPSSREEDPEFRWFHFNQAVAIERFYIFVTRERLPEILIEEQLAAFCRDNPEGCPWRPSTTQWKQLLAQVDTAAHESQSREFGQAQSAMERDFLRRDVGLPPGAPSPARVKMNLSPQSRMLMLNIDLIHK